MNSPTKALPNQTDPRLAGRGATRLPLAVATFMALVGALSCTDGGDRLTGPLTPLRLPVGHKTHYDSVAPLTAKQAWRSSGSLGPSASRITLRGAGPLASMADAGAAMSVEAIPFAPEDGPFATVMPECDDCTFGELDSNGLPTGNGLPLGFSFTFYGNSYNEFWFSTNGFIMFQPQDNGCCQGELIPAAVEPSGASINNIIAFSWTDLNMKLGQVTYETRGTEPDRRFILNLSAVEVLGEPATVSTQLVLFEGSNAIEIHTLKLPLTEHLVTQGAENSTGTEAAYATVPTARVRAQFALDRDAIRIVPAGANRVPTVNPGGNAGGPPVDHYEGVEGKAIKFVASGDDADKDPLSYAWDFNGDGVTDAESAEAEYTYPDNGKFSAKVTVTDGRGGSANAAVDVLVENANPSAKLVAADAVDEGSPIQLSVADIVDSPADMAAGYRFAFDCGTGEGYGEFSSEPSASCATVDNGVRAVAMKVRDKDDGEVEYTKSVTIRNVIPAVDAGPNMTVMSGQLVTLGGRFSDVGVVDRLWNWAWSTPDEGVAVARKHWAGGSSSEQGPVPGQYRACGVGPQVITLAVTDKDGGRGEGTVTVTVQPRSVNIGIKPSVVALSENARDEDSDSDDENGYSDEHGRLVTVYLYSTADFDATSIDPSTVRLTNGTGKGTPLAVKKKRKVTQWEMKTAHLNGDRLRDMKLRFSRKALIENGDLTGGTANLTLVARAGSCAYVGATAPVVVSQ